MYKSLVFGDEFLAQGLHIKSHQRCSAGIKIWLPADQSSSSTLTESSFLFDPCLTLGGGHFKCGHPVDTRLLHYISQQRGESGDTLAVFKVIVCREIDVQMQQAGKAHTTVISLSLDQ